MPGAGEPVALGVRHVVVVQQLAVDEHEPAVLADRVAGQADQTLDERVARAALGRGQRRRLEDDDLPPLGALEAIDQAVGDDAVVEARLTVRRGLCAVERRLHRRRGNAVRLRDLGLDEEDDSDRDRDRDDPAEEAPRPHRSAFRTKNKRFAGRSPSRRIR